MLASNSFNAEEILEGILAWARVESPTYEVERVNRMMDIASEAMSALGATIDRVPGRDGFADIVRATIKGAEAGPGILVLGHLDTVHPVGTIDGPLRIRRDGDKVYGPGVFDMKGGMYLACFAMRQLLRAGARPRRDVTFMFISDEEVGSPSTRRMIEAEAARNAYVLVPEPSRGGKVVTGRHAFLRWKLHVYGRPAHAGADNRLGKSAIRVMARLIERVEAMSDYAKGQTYSVGIVRGGVFVNVVPIECHAEILCVAPTEADMDEVRRNMTALAGELDGTRVEVEPGVVRPLFKPHPGTLALFERARAIAGELGFALDHGQFGGGSDGNFTGALGIATLDGLGVLGGGAHTHDEHLLVSSLEPRARMIAGLLETLS